ncbi:S-adenosylmethionine:tRNA ribosyltransferase-isomerase [Candidatus Amesbacteria bacterium]|nr:S-adenosylmethionine:tRNA ribosyltransferase-isomerase [Candidatus Amesbacteria bacterium]
MAKRVVAVGTTRVRVLESDWAKNETNIFIYPNLLF